MFWKGLLKLVRRRLYGDPCSTFRLLTSILLVHHSAFQRLPLYISTDYANPSLTTPPLTPTILQKVVNVVNFENSASRPPH